MERPRRIIAAAAATLALTGCTDSPVPRPPPQRSTERTQQLPQNLIPCDPQPKDKLSVNPDIMAYVLKCGDTAGILFLQKTNNGTAVLDVVIAPPPNNGTFETEVELEPPGTKAKTAITDWQFTSVIIFDATATTSP